MLSVYFHQVYTFGGFRWSRALSIRGAVIHADSLTLDTFHLFY